MIKRYLFSIVLFLVAFTLQSQEKIVPVNYYRNLYSGSFIQDKNFYFLTVCQKTPEVRDILKKSSYLDSFGKDVMAEMKKYDKEYQVGIQSFKKIFRLTEENIKQLGQELLKLISEHPDLKNEMIFHLRSSGNYSLFHEMSDNDLITASWELSASGLNHIIDVYALGKAGRYPAIDSAMFDTGDQQYEMLVEQCVNQLSNREIKNLLFFEPSLEFALTLLELNNRNEAGRFEPLAYDENFSAYTAIQSTDWEKYHYSCILVPGYGPQENDLAIHPLAKLRCSLAAKRYFDGMAPVIILSGGYVHPFQTPYCEAFEMKKQLMKEHEIPESAILIEPHARHTTTNFRNAVRLMFHYGIPLDKKALVTTSKYQSYYISDMDLDKRCERELGYVPFILHERLSPTDIEFSPVITSLHHDPIDPLDP